MARSKKSDLPEGSQLETPTDPIGEFLPSDTNGKSQEFPPESNGAPPQNGNAPRKPPVKTLAYFSDSSTRIEAAIWCEDRLNDQGKYYKTFSVSIRRTYRKDGEKPEWVESKSFRPHDLPVLLHALNQAYIHIMEFKTGNYFVG